MNNRKNKLVTIYLMMGICLLVVGFSYAFFAYYKTGLYTHTINGGKMNVIYDEITNNSITIDNAYPKTDKEALEESIEFEFSITGYNESEKNVYYAIEMDYGNEISSKERFKDTDIKISLFENELLVFENEIFQNLDNQDIYYGYIHYGTSKESPTVNNYKLRLWINDNVYIHNAIDNDITLWDDYDFAWAEKNLDYDILRRINNGGIETLDECGISIYTPLEYEKKYASFKVNVEADLIGEDIGMLFYDANGGEFSTKSTLLATNMITMQKPVMDGKGFLGWSSVADASTPEYYAGDYYSGEEKILYAVYSDTRNVMGSFPDSILAYAGSAIPSPKSNNLDDYSINQLATNVDNQEMVIYKIYFINDTRENIDERYNAASIKADLTYNNQGSVKAWLEEGDDAYYILYIGAEGTIYLKDCKSLFSPFLNCNFFDLWNVDTSMVTDMSDMFHIDSYISISYVFGLEGLNTSNVTNMSNMFNEFYADIIDVSNFNTSLVTDMSYMFYNCGAEELNLRSFDTSNVLNMSNMFYLCSSVSELDVSSFVTKSVNDMSNMFYNCRNLKKLDVSNFDTSNVTNMSGMFAWCENLTELDLRNFDTSNVIDMNCMFGSCDLLKNLDVSNFDTLKVEDMSSMFSSCINMINLDLGSFNTKNVNDMSSMFNNCCSLKTLNIINFDTSNVTSMNSMFRACKSLINLDLSHFNTSKVEDMSYMFAATDYGNDMMSLKELNVSSFDTSNVNDMSHMFHGVNLKRLNLTNFNTEKVTDMGYMFCNCKYLLEIDLSNFDASNVTYMYDMFKNCESLTRIDLSSFYASQVTSASDMFSGCKNLTVLDLSNFHISSSLSSTYIFEECSSLKELIMQNCYIESSIIGADSTYLTLEKIDLTNSTLVGNMNSLFGYSWLEGKSYKEIILTNVDTSQVTSMANMFKYCSNLTELDLSSFDTSNVTNMSYMFAYCSNLTSLDLYNFDISKLTNVSYMFSECVSLTTIYCDKDWNVENITSRNYMFENCIKLVGAISYDSILFDIYYANPDTGYFTRKTV